jgi:DNA-binding transcriptional ArsR family regulator
MALVGALCASVHAITAITNRSLRARVAVLLGDTDYSTGQMSYDLRRLRMKGIIERIEDTNTYRITDDGLHVAVYYSKLYNRLLRPLIADTYAPPPVRRAFRALEAHVDDQISEARMAA